MKFSLLFVIMFSLFACNQPKHAQMEAFWADFQKAIAENNRAAVADMTIFPLKGTEFFGANFNEDGLSREQFLQQYESLFDDRTKQIIATTAANQLVKFANPKASALEKIGVPTSSEIYSLNFSYLDDEGQETQTESSVTFYFLKKDGNFKLAFLLIAG